MTNHYGKKEKVSLIKQIVTKLSENKIRSKNCYIILEIRYESPFNLTPLSANFKARDALKCQQKASFMCN